MRERKKRPLQEKKVEKNGATEGGKRERGRVRTTAEYKAETIHLRTE